MRVYAQLQAELSKKADLSDYVFMVEAENPSQLEDWVVAGMEFRDSKRAEDHTIVRLYVYKVGEGFKQINLVYEVRPLQVALLFKEAEITGDVPKL